MAAGRGSAVWGDCIYENEYVKEDGVWKIKKIRAPFMMYSNYPDGWQESDAQYLAVGSAHDPARSAADGCLSDLSELLCAALPLSQSGDGQAHAEAKSRCGRRGADEAGGPRLDNQATIQPLYFCKGSAYFV